MSGSWLPIGHPVNGESRIQVLLYEGNGWQIVATRNANTVLIAQDQLFEIWFTTGLVPDTIFGKIVFRDTIYHTLECRKEYELAPISQINKPTRKSNALAFATAFRESRLRAKDVSFHNSVYVEQYSRFLPTSITADIVDDKVVLGAWITGGVEISTDSFERLTRLNGWLTAGDLHEVVICAGFGPPPSSGSNTISKHKSDVDTESTKDYKRKSAARNNNVDDKARRKEFSLAGRPKLEKYFNDHIIDIIENAERYRTLGIHFPSAIVLHGPPGCGKTYAVERLIEYLDWPSYSMDSSSIGSPYIHDTAKKISEVFDTAIENAPSVIIIDEMEAFLTDRRASGASGSHRVEEVAEFLRRIPEAIKNNVLIIAMTNMIDLIDPAILRRGRFDHIVEVGMASTEEVKSLIDALFNKLPRSEDISSQEIAESLTGRPLSDVAFLVRESARIAAKSGKQELDLISINEALVLLNDRQQKSKGPLGFTVEDE